MTMTSSPPPFPDQHVADRPKRREYLLWVVIILVGGSVFCGIFGGVFYILKTSEASHLAVSRVQSNSEAMNVLGAPISTGIPTGKISTGGGSGRAQLS